jgi:hypothetical protein
MAATNSNNILTTLHGAKIGLSSKGRLLVNPTGAGPGAAGIAYTAAAAASTITNTTSEVIFDNFITIPGNSLEVGSLVKIRYGVSFPATTTSDTAAIKAYIGGIAGTALISHAATDVANSNVVQGEYELIVRTIGSSGTVVGVGTYKSIPAAEATATYKDDVLASTTLDTTVNQVIGVSCTWSAASTNDAAVCDFLRVEVH